MDLSATNYNEVKWLVNNSLLNSYGVWWIPPENPPTESPPENSPSENSPILKQLNVLDYTGFFIKNLSVRKWASKTSKSYEENVKKISSLRVVKIDIFSCGKI